jgi:Fe-S cluster biogenesis protein NfuA
VSDLAAQVSATLTRSVLPSVIARGGAIRVAAAAGADGVVTLEVTGSPGAALPLASRIEAAIRAAVPQVTAVRLVTPGTSPSGSQAGADWYRRMTGEPVRKEVPHDRGACRPSPETETEASQSRLPRKTPGQLRGLHVWGWPGSMGPDL